MARGNPEIYKSARQFQASDDWGEPLADKPTQVKLPQSMKNYVDAQPDRGAWLRRAVAAAIAAEQQGGTSPVPVPISPPTASHRYSRAELEALSANQIVELMKVLKAGGVKIKLGREGKAQMIDRILTAQQSGQ